MPDIKHIDRAVYPPTLSDGVTSAWKVDLSPLPPEKLLGGVAVWIVFAPWSHIWWPYCAISCVHLRPIAGLPPAKVTKFGATHELIVAAIDPRTVPEVDPFKCSAKNYLRPLNVALQFTVQEPNPVKADLVAAQLIEGCVKDIIGQTLSPDSDFASLWKVRFDRSF
jgi:hypothetical protein